MTADTKASRTAELAADLYALVVYLHKNCNSDLFAAVGELELSLSQIKLLHHLEHAADPIALKEAAEFVRVSLPAASRFVDDLVKRGFVVRDEDAEDRRIKRLTLTESGRAVTRRLNAARLSGCAEFAASLDDTERAAVHAALTKLMERDAVAACRPDDTDPPEHR